MFKNLSIKSKIVNSIAIGGAIIVLITTFTLYKVYTKKSIEFNINKITEKLSLIEKLSNPNINKNEIIKIMNKIKETDKYIKNIYIYNYENNIIKTIKDKNIEKILFSTNYNFQNKWNIKIEYSIKSSEKYINRLIFRMSFVTIAFLLLVIFVSFQVSKIFSPFSEIVNYLKSFNVEKPVLLKYKDSNKISKEFSYVKEELNNIVENSINYSKKINDIANEDYLTKLHNRLSFEKRINNKINNKEFFTLLFFDLDGFKTVNDSLGHKVGDEVLKLVSKVLLSLNENNDTFRIGGDEFILLLETTNKNQINNFCNLLIEKINKTISINKHNINITTSIGISIYNEKNINIDSTELLKLADIAMYKKKEKGKNGFEYFKPYMKKEIEDKINLENEIKEAIKNKEFFLHYQPQKLLNEHKIISFESLLRWKHPSKGIVFPDYFIEFLENSNLMIPLGYQIIEESCDFILNIKKEFKYIQKVSINVASKQFEDKNFYFKFMEILEKKGCDPKYIEIEITERVLLKNICKIKTILSKFRKKGITIAIDDFGTGESSLSIINDLPIDKLKIDKSFIDNINNNQNGIVDFIITLSNDLGLSVIAEGVETTEQKEYLIEKNCNLIQGYLISKPLDYNSLLIFLEDNNNKNYNEILILNEK